LSLAGGCGSLGPEMSYAGTRDYDHGNPSRLGVLLVNLGTPEAPTVPAVRRYLAEFLSDPRVIEWPAALRWLLLHGVILRLRPRRAAHAYAQVWTTAGSPLLVHSTALAAAVRTAVANERVDVELAMRYGEPSMAGALERLRTRNAQRLLVLPLYPQYSATTTASVFDRVFGLLARWRWIPELRLVNHYHDDDGYLAAIANSIAHHWVAHARKHLLFSFHSIPRRYLTAGDPYHCHCHATARSVAERLGLGDGEWTVSFQSRFGREPWLEPYTDATLRRFALEGCKAVSVVCPGFATDCLETLEEIALRNRADFLAAGGVEFDYVPCLNADPGHAALLAQLIGRHAQGWPDFGATTADRDLARSRERALALGAPR
jgi:ferrochelatase